MTKRISKKQLKEEIEEILKTEVRLTKKTKDGLYVSKMNIRELTEYKNGLQTQITNIKINKEKLKVIVDAFTENEKKMLVISETVNGVKTIITRYMLNTNTILQLKKIVETKNIVKLYKSTNTDSDSIVLEILLGKSVCDFELENVNIGRYKTGSFFKYNCLIDLDFSRYGILKEFNAEYYKDNCIIHALKCCNVDEVKINSAKTFIKDGHLSLCKLNELSDKIKVNIILHRDKMESNKHTKKQYGSEDYDTKIDIAYYDEHYFIYETTNITSYAIENYELLKDKKEFNKIYNYREGKGYDKKDNQFINSLRLIVNLLENKDKVLKKIIIDENMLSTNYYNKVEDKIEKLEYCDNDIELYEGKKTINKLTPQEFQTNNNIVFFDFETITSEGNINEKFVHIPYMVSYSFLDDDEIKNITCLDMTETNNLGEQFLLSLLPNNQKKKTQYILYAHNMRYDLSFISKYLQNIKTTVAGNKIIQLIGYFKGYQITVKDSYCLISDKLSNFPAIFSIEDCNKELINYSMYNEKLLKKEYIIDCEELLNVYYTNNKELFNKNIEKWHLLENGKVDIIEYAKIYCNQDVNILKKGFIKFNKWIYDLYEIDTYQCLSISGVADKVLKSKGCYDGTYALSGVVRKFIAQSVVGGRTMIANNKKEMYMNKLKFNKSFENKEEEYKYLTKTLKQNISDFDGVSLYPSSMARMNGFIKGKPKPFYNMSYEELKQKDYYFVEIKIKEINVKRSFSLISMKNEEGVRVFNNTYIDKVIVVDKTTLEDIIEFQKVKFEIIKGYYFDEGFNNKVNSVIRTIFNKRLEEKKNKNPIQLVYKLLMNSAYGKTILKEQETNSKYFESCDEMYKYMSNHYNNIIEGYQLKNDNKFVVKERNEVKSHFNYCHIGSYILSMSKRIMNEVICLAEDLNLNIMYQDTDSMHIEECDLNILIPAYKNKYNRELTGEDLGQFHPDFSLDKRDGGKFKNIKAVSSIFLGKKCYIDVLRGDNADYVGVHTRMKGISEEALNHTANKLYSNHKTVEMRLINLYYDLYEGKKIEFDLLCDNEKVKFECFDLSVRSILEFKREIKFD